jgi:hypothetical protein
MGAHGFAIGNHVAFNGAPSLHTAAHEAAHVVQQRSGLQLSGGVGRVGDTYETHADAVAALVVGGQSAEGLLDTMAGGEPSSVSSASGPVQRDLATPEAYTAMKANAREDSTPRSGQLSSKNYRKQVAKYTDLRTSNDDAGAYAVLLELRKRFTDLDNKGDDYWKSDELKERYFRPLEQTLTSELEGLGESLYIEGRGLDDDAAVVTPLSSADEAVTLWSHFTNTEQDLAGEIWTHDPDLRARMIEVMATGGDELKLSNLSYMLEAVLPQRRQGLAAMTKRWLKSEDVEAGLEAFVDAQFESNPNRGFKTEYFEDEARVDTRLSIQGGSVQKGPDREPLTTDAHSDAIVMSEDEFYSAKKGESSKGQKVMVQHSSFLAGLPVQTAGMIKVVGGTVQRVQGFSGHYHPTDQHLARLCLTLQARGVAMRSVTIETKDAEEYDGLPAFLAALD